MSDRILCTTVEERPLPSGPGLYYEHASVHEDGPGCWDGCCADYKCDDCGTTWRAELPQ